MPYLSTVDEKKIVVEEYYWEFDLHLREAYLAESFARFVIFGAERFDSVLGFDYLEDIFLANLRQELLLVMALHLFLLNNLDCLVPLQDFHAKVTV